MNKFLLFLLSLAATQLTAQCIGLNNCPVNAPNFCDPSPNSPLFWNEIYWTDHNGGHDLPEAPVALSLKATAFCPSQTLVFRYLLFLDTDNDGVQETVVNSAALPGFNTVNYNNAGNPNYTGGNPRAFDQRPLPANQKYGFALQQTTTDSIYIGAVAWNTQVAPGTYTAPLLPTGTHRIRWTVANNTGEERTCEYTFTVKKDCLPPIIICHANLSSNILPTQMLQVFDADFLQFKEDNVSPEDSIRTGLRRIGQETGFPLDSLGNILHSVTFTCNDLGIQEVELWAIDEAGNANFCTTTILVQDNLGACPPVSTNQPANYATIKVLSNPFAEALRVAIQTQQPAIFKIRLTDQTGREILSKTAVVSAGNNLLEIPAATLPDGLYFLWLQDQNGFVRLEKMVKQ